MSASPSGARTTARPDRVDVIVCLAAIGAFVLYTWLGLGLTFWSDEWGIINDRAISPADFVAPFNEHWLGVTIVVYRAMLAVVGMHTYVPYLALLTIIHIIVALEIYVLARRRTHAWLAAGVALVTLLFGSGFENLFWGAQISFVGAAALGFGALVLVDDRPTQPGRGRAIGAAVLLTLGVMTSGYGLFGLSLVGLDIVLARRRWHLIAVPLVPGMIYVAWYLLLGRAGVATHVNPFTATALASLPDFIWRGTGEALAAATGFGAALGRWLVFALVGLLLALAARRRPIPRRALACFLAIVVEYAIVGLVRSQLEVDATKYTRYTYFSGIVAMLGLVTLVGTWRPSTPRVRLAATAVGLTVGTLALLWNVQLLFAGRGLYAERADLTRAFLVLAETEPLPTGVPPERSLIIVPSPIETRQLVAKYGSPLTDSIAPSAVPPVSMESSTEALRRALNPPDWLLAREAAEDAGLPPPPEP